jgi:hypothetical protein
MNEFLENTVRLEADDLQRHWHESQNQKTWHLSLRIGNRTAGLIRAERKSPRELIVVLDQKAEHTQTIQLDRLADDAGGQLIVECPACRRWRRRMFVSSPGFGPGAEAFQFVCKDCAFRNQLDQHFGGVRKREHPDKEAA